MVDQSQYLAQALQELQAGAQPQPTEQPGMSLAQMQAMQKDRAAFELANPGQNYMAHGLQKMGQNVMQAPQNAISGFAKLAQSLPGMAPR